MTLGSDHFTDLKWDRTRSILTLIGINLFFAVLLFMPSTRGFALVGLAILTTVMLHEAGHFVAAKWAGMKATEFFVGFGPRIWSFTKGETEYGIKAIPLGGYVKIIGMTDMDEVPEEDEPRTYRKARTYKKLIVIMAGVTVNMILAFLLFFTMFLGQGVVVDINEESAVIESALPGTPAYGIGLQEGDQIVAIGENEITTFDDLFVIVQKYDIGEQAEVTFIRDGKTITREVEFQEGFDNNGAPSGEPFLGVNRQVIYERPPVGEAATLAAKQIYFSVDLTIGRLTDRFSASGLSEYSSIVANGEYERQDRPKSVAGIVNTGGQLVNQNIWDLFALMAVVNIFLGLLNALPILPLDGGHAAVAIYESVASRIMKRPVKANYKKLIPVISAFVGVMILLMLSSLWLDVLEITS
jgi:membrane-associated protease RseP (regulator of RpoE activity)